MKTQFATTTLVSFHLWLDNYITDKGQAYYNATSKLYYQPDPQLGANYVAYASPFKSWVCDSGVQGANILESITYSGGMITRESGMMVDYDNGRVILPAAFGSGMNVTGSYAFKELNFYKANETDEKLIFTNKYYLNSRFARPATGVPPPRAMVTPCVFISNSHGENEQYALGGLYNTKRTISLNILAENLSQLEGVLSLVEDSVDRIFPQLSTSTWPLNAYGDVKSGYNYDTISAQNSDENNQFYISEVVTSKVGDGTPINESIFLGVADITVERLRTIH